MKLITEQIDPQSITVLQEGTGENGKNWYITGPFMQCDIKNRNGRIYPKKMMERAVSEYKKTWIDTHRSLGELNHPSTPEVNPERASHLIESLEFEGNDIVGKAKILTKLPMGRIVAGLLEEGVQLGVSSRGLGTLNESDNTTVNDDYVLSTIDIVSDPSAPSAFVDGIFEAKEFIISGDTFVEKAVDELEDSLSKHGSKYILEDLKSFLNDIRRGI